MKKHVFYLNLLKIQAMKGMRLWLVGLAILLAYIGAQGQGWIKYFDYEFPPSSEKFVVASLLTPDSGIIVLANRWVRDLSNQMVVFDTTEILLYKFDKNGTLLFSEKYYSNNGFGVANDFCATSDGGFVIVGSSLTPLIPLDYQTTSLIIKVDENGEELWQQNGQSFGQNNRVIEAQDSTLSIIFSEQDSFGLLRLDYQGNSILTSKLKHPQGASRVNLSGVLSLNGGETIIAGNTQNDTTGISQPMLIKLDLNGNLIWQKLYGQNAGPTERNSIVENANGGVIFLNTLSELNNPFFGDAYVISTDINGNLEAETFIGENNDNEYFFGINKMGSGYILFGSSRIENSRRKAKLINIDENGTQNWEREYGSIVYGQQAISAYQRHDGSFIIVGDAVGVSDDKMMIIKTDSLGNTFSSALTGTLHQDPQSDCLPDPAESGLSGWLVQATGTQSFATLSDSLGHFTLPVDTGSYTVTVAPPSPYWEVCNSPTTASITAFYDTLTLDFPAQAIADCPYLTVDISAPFLRRCFDNNYYVHYCNDGTITAEDAAVEVTLDPYFTYVSSTFPPASQNGNTLTFDIGDVAVGDCGSFQITAFLDCDSTVLGQTHCTSAHISPDSLCLQPDPLWDGSSIEVDASCSGDSVVFTITNVGSEGMPAPLGFIIIEDQIVLMSGDFELGTGESTTVTAPSNGTTLHLEAQQAAAHPSGFASTGATIEGCGGWLSLGFFTQWSFDDDPDPFTDVDCQANVSSFDPNDKQGFPAGLGDEHLIEPGQDIEYLIRFQNTGTDTAFKVTVVDVLPPELDLATVRPGASSHPYTYGVTPEGWLTFTFENIMLPDSNVNEAASHGFVRFRASQRPGLGWGNVIANTALIYFDFNAPVQTNTFMHRIGQVFPWTMVGTTPPVFKQKTNVKIVPNPLTDSALLQVEGIETGPLNLVLTDVSGKILRQQTVNGTGFEFQRGELNPGLYFFKIERNGEQVGSGKLMVR